MHSHSRFLFINSNWWKYIHSQAARIYKLGEREIEYLNIIVQYTIILISSWSLNFNPQLFENIVLEPYRQYLMGSCGDSSVGRALDWRFEGHVFDPRSPQKVTNIFERHIWIHYLTRILPMKWTYKPHVHVDNPCSFRWQYGHVSC